MGKKIEKYQLGKTLGRGTFSKVKYGIDTTTNKAYAVKIIDRKMVKKENMESQLKREIAIMKILKHKHVVNLREVLQSNKNIYIVLELVTGGELFDRIVKERYFSETQARTYFQQLMLGIEYCHSQGIAHRDLKPENLLLDEHDCLKISDFGLSALSSSTDGKTKMLTTTCGTPNYVAPEVLKERGYNGFNADIWSCGVILYVMLAGFLPFEDENMTGLFNKIESGVYTFPPHFSADAKNLISRMLVVDPNKRIPVADIMKHKWFVVGFKDENRYMAKVNVDEDMVNKAFSHAQEAAPASSSSNTSSSAPSPSTNTASSTTHSAEPETLNAFDLASRLMIGAFNPLMSNGPPIRRETRFMVRGAAAEVIQKLTQTLEELKAKPTVKSKEIKCFVHQSGGVLISFVVEVNATAGGFCMVEVRRGKADILEFNKFYRVLLGRLSDFVVSKESK